jgi:hypothetical protein
MTKDEALRIALRAMVVNNYAWKYLAESGDVGNFEAEEQGYYQLNEKAIIAVEAALEVKNEPVALAWAEGYQMGIADERTSEANIGIAGFNAKVEPARENPYVTTPPQRKPLTDDQIYEMYNEPRSDAEMLEFARAIEAAHGIKGEA